MLRKRGFTLIELLVVIAIIALLLAVITPALRKAKESALRVCCASSMRQTGMAMVAYAATYENFLPTLKEEDAVLMLGSWLFDFPSIGSEFIRQEYKTINMMYCPANSRKEFTQDELMEYYFSHIDENTGIGWAVTDYFWLMAFGHPDRLDVEYRDESNYPGKKMFLSKLDSANSGGQPLITDVVFTQDSETASIRDFTNVESAFIFRSNHVRGIEALGGNTLFADGSTKWVDFSEMYMNHLGWGPGSAGTQHYW